MIPVNAPLLSGNEKKYLNECIDTGWISSEGGYVKRFESELANYVSRDYGIAVSNGSAALDIAVKALGIADGDEVIIPAFSIISPALSIVRQGAIPVLVDCLSGSFNMDPELIESKITPKTKAIIVIHTYNFPVNMDPILKLAKEYNLRIIEDAAEMIGQSYKNCKCGSFGDISTFSFYANKHITTGEGGMVLTNDEEIAEKCRELRNLCFQPQRRFVHEDIGWNYRMTNIQAAIGVAQLERIEYSIRKKTKIGNEYTKLLSDIPSIDLPERKEVFADNIYWIYPIVLKESYPLTAMHVMQQLAKKEIGSRPFFCPMNAQPVFRNMGFFVNESYPVAERLYDRGFYIPSGLGLSKNQQHEVSDVLHNILL